MFKIIAHKYYSLGTLKGALKKAEDPLIVDVRYKTDEAIKTNYKRDYVHLRELVDRGDEVIIFISEEKGNNKLQTLLDKAKNFARELVIIYENPKHIKAIRRLLDERKN